MGLLDDTAVFAAVVQQGGFSRAAKQLGLSNGLISRRIAKLEADLGVTLLKRTTRALQLTPEGEVFWQHAKLIQQEMDKALCVIHSLSDKPKGDIRISAPVYFGRYHIIPILNQFRESFPDINLDVFLTDEKLDPIKYNIDLLIRSTGYFDHQLKDSTLKTRLLTVQPISLFATSDYLIKHGVPATPDDLHKHSIIGHANLQENVGFETWQYSYKGKVNQIQLTPKWRISDVSGRWGVCCGSQGIGKFTALINQQALSPLQTVLPEYDWGKIHLYALYAHQQALPKRSQLLLDFITAQFKRVS